MDASPQQVPLRGETGVVRVEGRGPAVLVLHGQLGTASVVLGALAPISGRCRILAPDIRGRGGFRCPHPDHHSWEAYTTDVVGILDYLSLDRVWVVGVSLGAGVALGVCLRHPERVAGVVLWSSPYAGAEQGWLPGQQDRQARILAIAEDLGHRGLDDALVEAARRDPTADIAGLRGRLERHDPPSISAALRGMGWSQPFADQDDLSAIAVPAVVVPADDELHPRSISDSYVKAIPSATTTTNAPEALMGLLERS